MSSKEKRHSCCSSTDHQLTVGTGDIHHVVRQHYGDIADKSTERTSCCGPRDMSSLEKNTIILGYTPEQLAQIPEGAKLGLGCGNPVGLSSIKPGEVVVDLGSGGGIDCFLAAQKVGLTGKVIGVDMTPQMLDLARKNLSSTTFLNIEFRLGEIEHLPIADATADLIISNCVINLSPDKRQVFSEIYRVLKPGGRMIVSDVVLEKELPPSVRESLEAYVGCIAGALLRDKYIGIIQAVGFQDFKILSQKHDESIPSSCESAECQSHVKADNKEITDKFSHEEIAQLAEIITSLTFKAKKS